MMASAALQHAMVQLDGIALHTLRFGRERNDAVPLLCLHGVTGTGWLWHDVAQQLCPGRQVIVPELRGHGDSQWSRDAAYATDDHLRDLEGLLDALAIDRCDLAGLSWGALIGIRYAARHPHRIRKLAILDVEPSFEQPVDAVPQRPESFPDLQAVCAFERAANPGAPEALLQLFAAGSVRPGENGTWVRKHDRFFLRRWPFRNDDVWAQLASLEMPLLLLHGADSFVRREVMERMAGLAGTSRFHDVAGAGHLLPLEAPHVVGAHLEEFFQA
ncbi:alpha/beta fold hydrolase [Cupriavidus nantongensis]